MNARVEFAAVAIAMIHAACNPSSKPLASDDPQRSAGGIVFVSDDEPARSVGTGPLFLTDIMIYGFAGKVFTSADATCKEKDPGNLFEWITPAGTPPEVDSHHGMRLLVPGGKTLCFQSSQGRIQVVWAGFHP
jgi:hypothetical protein